MKTSEIERIVNDVYDRIFAILDDTGDLTTTDAAQFAIYCSSGVRERLEHLYGDEHCRQLERAIEILTDHFNDKGEYSTDDICVCAQIIKSHYPTYRWEKNDNLNRIEIVRGASKY